MFNLNSERSKYYVKEESDYNQFMDTGGSVQI